MTTANSTSMQIVEPTTINPAGSLPYNLSTDDDAATYFSDLHRGELFFCDQGDKWYLRQNEVFEPISHAAVQGVVSQFAQSVTADYQRNGQPVPALKNRAKINSIIELSRSKLLMDAKHIDARRRRWSERWIDSEPQHRQTDLPPQGHCHEKAWGNLRSRRRLSIMGSIPGADLRGQDIGHPVHPESRRLQPLG